MPDHLARAVRCERLAAWMAGGSSPAPEWEIVVLFYAALHYVDAYFEPLGVKVGSHPDRLTAVGRDSRARRVYHEFASLYNESMAVRYYGSTHAPAAVAPFRAYLAALKRGLGFP